MKPLLGHTVLVVEDERGVRMLQRIVLEAAGAQVIEAEHGEQALRLLELHERTITDVLTDLNMPRMDGLALVTQIRMRHGHHLPIVVCTAAQYDRCAPGLTDHVQGIVRKPFVPAHLVQAIAEANRQTAYAVAV
jgi:CheY-like chemotaxis protein